MARLDANDLIAEARAKTGLRDFGDEGFREPLDVLLDSLEREANLNEAGLASQRARLVDSLATRLAAQDCFARHPEIGDERIEAPLVVIALPRSGTTHLHRLRAAEPAARAGLGGECRSPAPWRGSDWETGDDPRIADAHEQVKSILAAVPELAAIHPWDPEGPDEEILLLEHSFLSHVPESGANVPGYNAWLEGQDMAPAYAYLLRLLRLLQWQKERSGRGGRHWVLKAPFHLGHLDTLFATFPDARVVQTHRDPAETLPSIASMYASLWRLASDTVDEHAIGRLCLHRYARALERCLASRERLPAERFLDVDYRDLVADPMAQVRRIYHFVGRPLRPAAEAAMALHLTDQARDKRAAHDYSLERFGYDADAIRRAFAAYTARFLPPR
ncbi:MAG: sulfotransferase family protein [Myxococcota bacterium]